MEEGTARERGVYSKCDPFKTRGTRRWGEIEGEREEIKKEKKERQRGREGGREDLEKKKNDLSA